jgi:hypothetical protein
MIDPALRDDAPAIGSRLLRQFAGLWLFVFGSLAFSSANFRNEPRLAMALAIVAVVVGVPGLFRPSSIRPVFIAAIAVTTPIGRVVTYVLLAALYYLMFTPIAIVFRLIGRDALARRTDQVGGTCWVPREQPSDPRRYLHQS